MQSVRVNEINMGNASDKEVFNYARDNDYILITMDLDFGYILTMLDKGDLLL